MGSDTGGSIRQPAGFCGLVGLKPTYGTVSRFGLIAYASSLDQIGPICKSVSDAALVYDAISGRDPMDSTSVGQKEPVALQLAKRPENLTIGVVKEYFQGVDAQVEEALQSAIRTYEKMGARIVDLSVPSVSYALPVYYILACAEASSNPVSYTHLDVYKRQLLHSATDGFVCFVLRHNQKPPLQIAIVV